VANIEEVVRMLKRPVPMRGIERKVTAAVLASLAFGITLSVSLRDWQYFERSGSLVTLVAIVLVWRDLVSLVGDMEKIYSGLVGSLKRRMDAARPQGLLAGTMHDGQFQSLGEMNADLAKMNALLRKRIRTMEAIVFGLGTFVWGYGAPIAILIWPFSAA